MDPKNTEFANCHNVGDAVTTLCNRMDEGVRQAPVAKPPPSVLSSIGEQITVLLEHAAKGELRDRLQYIDGIIYLGRDPDDDEQCPSCGSYRHEVREFEMRGGGSSEQKQCADCERIFDERGIIGCSN